MAADNPRQNTGQGMLAIAVLGVLAILILPLPALVLDILLAFNIGVSVLILLVALSLEKPLDFSVFPSLLLITTLFRLGLNVATTRLILLKGGEGARAAGDVIETFGRFAVGGSLIVGAVVFLILLAVNFSVITKGSGRVAEVAARFTLDASPGKQMSIDADLAAGLIDERAAKTRRAGLEREIEFFGAMDGASKFVRGDAVAGLIITGINIVGGLLAGLIRDHMSLASAVESFTILTIGDGLVSQMPALLISTAAGIVVTRAGSGAHLGLEIGGQIFGRSRTLSYAAGVLGALATVPGLPTIPFGLFALGAFLLSRRRERPESERRAAEAAAEAAAPKPERMQDLIVVDAIELEVGHGLLLLSPELLVLPLVADVEALASRGIGIDVLPLPVLRLRQHLSWRQRLELRELVRSVGRPRLEAGGREGLLGGVRVGGLQSRTSAQAHGAQQSNE